MSNLPKTGVYQHFKGGRYQLHGFARHSETEEWLVIYEPLYAPGMLWARPLTMWQELVDVGGEQMPRFQLLEG